LLSGTFHRQYWFRLITAVALAGLFPVGALPQTQSPGAEAVANARRVRPLILNRTTYRLRAGEAVTIAAPTQTVELIRNARSRRARVGNIEQAGFVIGPGIRNDEILLAASLTTQPGQYTVTVSAVNDSGEEQAAEVNVSVEPLQAAPSTASKPPVVLLNGLQPGLTNGGCPLSQSSADTFGSLESYLYADGVPVVYFFDNCAEGPNWRIEDLGNKLKQVLGLIRYDNGELVAAVDAIGHSMGGLIVRSYLAGLQADGTLSPPTDPRIRKFIQVATPNFGSYKSVNLGVQTAEMIPGSAFLWSLATWNQRGDDLRGVDALAIAGNLGYESLSAPANGGDGLVSLTSASLGFARDSSRTRILPYCHSAYSALDQLLVDCSGTGIAKAPESYAIIRSFLAGTSDWQSIGTTPPRDPWLSRYGGMYFADQTASGQWVSDLTSVSFGTVMLDSGGATGKVFYKEFVPGTDTFHLASASLGALNCGPLTEPPGFYTAWRCKSVPLISAVGPLFSGTPAKVVQSGTTATISGIGFGQQRCASCSVFAYPGPVSLQISSWADQTIRAVLPSSYNGLTWLVVQTANGSDSISFMAAPAPAISLSQTQLQFSYTLGSGTPAPQTITIGNGGGGTLSWTATPMAGWLAVTVSSASTLRVSINPSGLAPGTYQGAVSITATGATNSPQTVSVTLVVIAATNSVLVTSVTNSASGAPGAIAPGEIVTIKGSGLGPAVGALFTVNPNTGMVDTTLAGTRVFFGGFAAPITYVSAVQINAIVPYEVAGQSQIIMQVEYPGIRSAGTTLQVANAAPGVFTFNATGSGQAIAANQDGSFNGPSTPAPKGSYVTIYFTGGGLTDPPGMTGSVSGSTLKSLTRTASVTVGGVAATVVFAGAAPALVDGVDVLVIRIADNTPSGSSLPLAVNVGGLSSPTTAMIAVQ